jgi:hypothetical protein
MSLTFLTGFILGQHGAQSSRLASAATNRTASSVDDILDVNERVDRVILVIDAIWSLLEESGYTDDQLRERIEHIDAMDGALDGRVRRPPTPCSKCGTKVAPALANCQFCGADVHHLEPPGPTTGI